MTTTQRLRQSSPLLAVLSFVALQVGAQERDPGEVVTRHVSTTAGRPVLVRNYAMWRADCTSRGEPVITVSQQPQHGTVSVRAGTVTIREHVGNAANCVGQQVPGMSVWYQPAAGFTGTDQFGLTIQGTHLLRDLAMVEVR